MKDEKKKIEINSEVEEKNKNVSDEEILSEDEINAVAGGNSVVKFGGISRTPVIVNCD